MIDEALDAKRLARTSEPQRTLDEFSMRFLELALAGIALVAALLLTVAR